ncbi:MAG: hypothetical protein D6754_14490 [Alphaproteobacteria bacterium]|nr:MAG: hypothetical protein D6754_14490 [Alphaproteobacteria bacterium]
MAECMARIGANPTVAREEAAQWFVLGGGAEAKTCEARALEALGARGTAAVILAGIAADRGNGLPKATRAAMMQDAGRLWLGEKQYRLSLEALNRAVALGLRDADLLAMRAEAKGRLGMWPEAVADLSAALERAPGRADLLTLRAAANRKSGDPLAGLADAEAALRKLPHYPEALFEKGASLVVLDRVPEALKVWFKLIELHPDSEMAELARRNMQRLSGN